MAGTKQLLLGMDPDEVFDWDSDNLDAGLKELDITIGKSWSKSKRAYELNLAIKQLCRGIAMPQIGRAHV